MDESTTWFATIILPASESGLFAHLCKCFLICPSILVSFSFCGMCNPNGYPRYRVTSPGGNHLSPSASPHCHVLSSCPIHTPVDLCRLSFAPEASPNLFITAIALSMFSEVPSSRSRVSSANIWFVMVVWSGSVRPLTLHPGCCNIWPSTSTVMRIRYGAKGHPCLTERCSLNVFDCSPLTMIAAEALRLRDITCLIQVSWNPIASMVCLRNVQLTLSYAFSKSRRSILISCLFSNAHSIDSNARKILSKMHLFGTKPVCDGRIHRWRRGFIRFAYSLAITL